jgi:hypothetical protein
MEGGHVRSPWSKVDAFEMPGESPVKIGDDAQKKQGAIVDFKSPQQPPRSTARRTGNHHNIFFSRAYRM